MSFVPHTPDEVRAMLERIGASDVGELFEDVPRDLRERAAVELPPALGEQALLRHFEERAARNAPASEVASFLGAGAYRHFIPAAVDSLSSRGEFSTAYTPYQAEISQGTLQAVFEFQTMICQLTGLEVANASLYDGASAVAEAALMAMRATRRNRVYASAGLHPRYLDVLRTYTRGLGAEIETLPLGADGRTRPVEPAPDAAAVLVQSPNFFGCVEEVHRFAGPAHEAGALLAGVVAEPLSLALLRSPGDQGADIACGEVQSFGLPLSFGGPYAGFMATRQELVRQLPGRLIGETVDAAGRRGFAMTLTAREQHIRRQRATSNICTNQGLCALRVAIYLALLGKRGLRQLAGHCYSLGRYARERLAGAGLRLPHSAPVFNEFAVEVPDLEERLARCAERGIRPGVPLSDFDPERAGQLLVCVTEMNPRAEIDALVEALAA